MEIRTRAQWGARPPKRTPTPIPVPTRELWLHHTASPTGFDARVRQVQDFHMDSRGWNDIAYSFLINHEGIVYEGRGAGIAGGHTAGHNTVSHAICVLGNYDQAQPSQACLNAIVELARHGFGQGWWPRLFTGGHRDASGASTSCPGDNLQIRIPAINQLLREEPDDMTPEQATQLQQVHTILTAPLLGQAANPTAPQSWIRTYNNTLELGEDLDVLVAQIQTLPKATVDELVRRLA